MLATLAKLKQVCNHPAQFLHDNSAIGGRSGKLARLTEMLDEALSAGDRALVFSQFAEMGGMLKKHLQETFGREVLFLHGGDAQARQRDRMVERFQAADDDGPADLHPVAQGGRNRAQPDGGEPRVSFRSLVEPGGGKPGDRPRLPDRPDAARAGSQVRLRRNARREDRRDDRAEARARRLGHRQRRSVDHQALECRAEGAVRTAGRCVRRMSRCAAKHGGEERPGGETMVTERWWRDRPVLHAVAAPEGRGRHQGAVQRGGFGESWWAKRWIQVLESFDIGATAIARAGRMRGSGQVLSIAVEKGRVTAKVQGSRPKPYDIAIEVKTLSDSRLVEGDRRPGAPGALRGEALGRRDAAGHRAGVHGSRAVAVSRRSCKI